VPLPEGGKVPWPPKEWQGAYAKYQMWAAWYSGDPNTLSAFYGGVGTPNLGGKAEGFFGTELSYSAESYDSPLWHRWMFWGKRAADPANRYRLHVPLASDIAQTSADHLFSEPPAFIIPEAREVNAPDDAKAIQQRLLDQADVAGIDKTLIEAAEISAALGGVYLRVTWDKQVAPDHPLLTAVHPDAAVPEISYGILLAVTFWRAIPGGGDTVYRHLERHEPGYIFHGLYKGTRKVLGWPVALSVLPETSSLLAGADLETQATSPIAAISTGLAGLTAAYVPNMQPNRSDRRSPLGRSDLDGVEGLMDALDEAMTSWMRDLRLGRARILVPEEMLDVKGKGQGAVFDADREVFTALNQLAGEGADGIQFVQPDIRTEHHLALTSNLIERIVQIAGYSPASFGMRGDGNVVTATEIAARERRSLTTRGKKATYWARPLTDMLERFLEIDTLLFGGPGVLRPQVQFADSVQTDMKEQAASLQLLSAAAAVSYDTRVRMLHPDWTDEQVAAEVGALQQEHGTAVPDLFQSGALP